MEKKAKYLAAPRRKKAMVGDPPVTAPLPASPAPPPTPPQIPADGANGVGGGYLGRGEGKWPVSAPTPSTSPPAPPLKGRGESVWLWIREVVLEMVTDIDWAMEVRRAVLMMIKSNSTQGFRDGCMMLAKAIEKRYNVK